MRAQNTQSGLTRGGSEDPRQRVMQPDRAVMRRPQFQIKRALGNPSRMFKYSAILLYKLILLHGGGPLKRLRGVMLGPVLGDFNAAGKPHIFMALCIIHEAAQRHNAPRASDQPAMQPD